MLLEIFSIKDKIINTYKTPFYAINRNEAIRLVRNAASDTNSLLHKNPEDFELYAVGIFDDETGKITTEMVPDYVMAVNSVVPRLHFGENNNEG